MLNNLAIFTLDVCNRIATLNIAVSNPKNIDLKINKQELTILNKVYADLLKIKELYDAEEVPTHGKRKKSYAC